MFVILQHKMFQVRTRFTVFQPLFRYVYRTYLSEAYDCTEMWNERLNNPVIEKINIEAMYYDLNAQYNKTKKICAIDVDIFLNSQTTNAYLTESEELVHKLRLTSEAHKVLPTTHHAFVRLFLNTEKKEDLIRILHDRLNYGIFTDNYLTLYMIDKLLKQNDFKNAAKVASLHMLQEDYSDPLVRLYSLYSIHKHLMHPVAWDVEVKEDNENDDEDVKRVRVPLLRNPYFDDHFDLRNGDHICGKSLVMIGSFINDDIGSSYKVLGLALFNKWDKLEKALEGYAENQKTSLLYKECLDMTLKTVTDKLTGTDKVEILTTLLNRINNTTDESLLEAVEGKLLEEVAKTEKQRIEEQYKLYKEWEVLRETTLKQHLAEITRIKRLEEVKKLKIEMEHKEQLLYYFENEEEIDLLVKKKKDLIAKRSFLSTDSTLEEEYIPPEVQKKRVVD